MDCTLYDGMSPVGYAVADQNFQKSGKIHTKKVVHFAPESVVHYTPDFIVHYTPEYSHWIMRRRNLSIKTWLK